MTMPPALPTFTRAGAVAGHQRHPAGGGGLVVTRTHGATRRVGHARDEHGSEQGSAAFAHTRPGGAEGLRRHHRPRALFAGIVTGISVPRAPIEGLPPSGTIISRATRILI